MRVSLFLRENLFPLILILFIIIAFSALHPTSTAVIFPSNKKVSWDNFTKDVSSKKRMDTRSYWEMREFYSPGYSVFDKEGIADSGLKKRLQDLNLTFPNDTELLTFLNYRSSSFVSYESLVSKNNAAILLSDIAKLSKSDTAVSHGENYVILQTAKDKASLVFLATEQEMQKANGFFDYAEEDREFVKDKYWLSVSSIDLN